MKVSHLLLRIRSMNNIHALVRSIITYAVCIPLAAIIGYMLTKPLSYSDAAFYSIILLVLLFPIIARLHYPLMFFCWSLPINLFFIKTSPTIGMVMMLISLVASLFDRILTRRSHFLPVPEIIVPVVVMLAIVFFTAEMTGGFGLKSFGSEVYGGKKYAYLVVGIIGYFALTARPIPVEKARLYVGLFLMGGVISFLSDLVAIMPSGLRFIYLFVSPSGAGLDDLGNYSGLELGVSRLSGLGASAFAIYVWMLAQYGVRGIFLSGKIWRIVVFALAFICIGFGGYRSTIIEAMAAFVLLFFMEKLHRSPLLFVFLMVGIMLGGAMVPLASKLPFVIQRGISFLPLELNPEATASAEASSDWRVNLWTAVADEIPKYLLIGKGYAITMEDWNAIQSANSTAAIGGENDPLAISSDFHNGPLSVIIPFGIWGAFVFIWIIGICIWILFRNYRYGFAGIKTINTFIFVFFLVKLMVFATVFGALQMDMGAFLGYVGLSVALNHGVCRPGTQTREAKVAVGPPAGRSILRPRPVMARHSLT